MSPTARVKSIEALSEWKGSLKRFVGEAWEILQSADRRIRQTEEWLRDRKMHWQHQIAQREEEVREAKRELESCQEDEENDCSIEEEALLEAKQNLRKARDELENVRSWMHKIEETVASYRMQADRLKKLLATDLPRADAFLGRAVADLQSYLATSPFSAGTAVPFISHTSGGISTRAWRLTGTNEEAEALRSALDRLAGTDAGKEIADAILSNDVPVSFGRLSDGTVARFNEDENEIVINLDNKHKSDAVLAAYLAHEGTHAQWWWNRHRGNSIAEEYAAFKAQDLVWRQVKGNESGDTCDDVSILIKLGEDRAKDVLRLLRPGLPDVT